MKKSLNPFHILPQCWSLFHFEYLQQNLEFFCDELTNKQFQTHWTCFEILLVALAVNLILSQYLQTHGQNFVVYELLVFFQEMIMLQNKAQLVYGELLAFFEL